MKDDTNASRLENLARAWVERYEIIGRLGSGDNAAKILFWAYEEVDRICEDAPKRALLLIEEILHITNNEFVLANLAAGPLETLLARHGNAVISEVEERAAVDSRFRSLLVNVMQNLMDDELWQRVLRASTNSGHRT